MIRSCPTCAAHSSRSRVGAVGTVVAAGGAVLAAVWLGAVAVPAAQADPGDLVAGTLDTNDALVLIPLANQDYANAADQLYLAPNGFDGTAAVFITPSEGGEVANVAPGVQTLVQTIEADYTAGDLSATDPLYVFGYSEGAVESGLAEQQLHDFGIPASDLHFVMVGDSASAQGGFLNSVVDSFPEAQQQSVTTLLEQLGLTPPLLGATTPDNLYPTDVYSFSGDGWADYDDGANIAGMFTQHLAYLGLTAAQVASASETTDGMTDYYTIDSSHIDFTTALYNQLLISLEVSPTADPAPVAAADTAAATSNSVDEVLGQAHQQLADATAVLDSAPTASLDSSAASVLASEETFAPTPQADLAGVASLQDSLPAGDQPVLADVDQALMTAYQGLVSADQAFLAADQAGDLSSQAAGLAELQGLSAELGLAHANFAVDPALIDVGVVDAFAHLAAEIGLSF